MSSSIRSFSPLLLRSALGTMLFFANVTFLSGQWESVQMPVRATVKKIFNHGDTYYAATNHAAYKSENYGQTWSEICRFESSYGFRNIRHRQDTIYYLTSDAIIQNAYDNPTNTCNFYGPFPNIQITDYVLTDNGALITNGQVVQRLNNQAFSWETVANLNYFPSYLNYLTEPVMDYHNGTVWMYGDQGIIRSDDFGSSWEILNDTLNIYSMFFSGDTILCETAQLGTMRSFDNGQNWTVLGNNFDFQGFCQSNGLLYGNHTVENNILSKIFVSSDFGETWMEILNQPKDIFIRDLFIKGNLFFCATEYGVVRSNNGGQSWVYSNTGLEGIQFANIFELSSLEDFAIYRESETSHFSKNGGQTWDGAMIYNYFGFAKLNGSIYTSPPEIYKCDGDISKWTHIASNFMQGGYFFSLGNDLGLGGFQGSIMRSQDEGHTWSFAGAMIAPTDYLLKHSNMLISSDMANFFKSNDFGANWQQTASQGLPPDFHLNKMYTYEDKLLAADTVHGLFISYDDAESWSNISEGLIPLSSTAGFNYPVILIGEAGIVVVNNVSEVFFTPDFGQTWGYFQTGIQIQANNQIHTGAATNDAFYLAAGETQLWRRDFSTAKLYSASGTVYRDENNNGLQEPTENGLLGVIVELMPKGVYTATNLNGFYSIALDAINDTVRTVLPITYASSTPAYHTAINTTSGLDFGINLSPNIKDLTVTLTENAPFRPGFSNITTLTYANKGTTSQTGQVSLMIDNQLEIENIIPMPSFISGNLITWNYNDLPLFAQRDINIKIKTPSTVAIGSPLVFLAEIDKLADVDTVNNNYVLNTSVVGSYDPNDKQVEPAVFTTESVNNQLPLTYTIRFQNTGNFPASFINITDTLSVNLDPATFRLISYSHPMTWTIEEKGIVKFRFYNINLPDSTSNEPASHGFVKYSIQAKPDLVVGDEIENTAYIYFDFNEPVVTNTATTKVENPMAAIEAIDREGLIIAPNPANDEISVQLPTFQNGSGKLCLISSIGELVLQKKTDGNSVHLNTSALPKGFYFVRWDVNKGIFTGKVVLQ